MWIFPCNTVYALELCTISACVDDQERDTFVNWVHLKKNTAPWLKTLVEYSYLLPKYSLKISKIRKKMGILFSFHFL